MENIIIIGGGPAGLSAAIYLARAGLKPLVFAGSPPGGQLTLTSAVENYPGYESILGPDLIAKMRKQAEKYGAVIRDENVKSVDFSKKPFEINVGALRAKPLQSAKPVQSKSVIIATGARALWLGLESEQRLRGHGVSACATCDGFFFRGKTAAVVGGGDTALEEALTLTKFASKVYLIHRRDSFRASKVMQERVKKNPKIEIIFNAAVEEVMGENRVEGIKLYDVGVLRAKPVQLKVEGLFVAIGHKPDTKLFSKHLVTDNKGYLVTSQVLALELAKIKNITQNLKIEEVREKFNPDFPSMTSVNGVFAAGDCVDHVYRQAATAAGMGVAAALDVEKYLTSVYFK